MALPLRGIPPKPKSATTAAPSATPTSTPEFKDSYGIVYVDGLAHIKVAVDVKLSRNYQSCGIQAGMEFTTKAAMSDEAIANGFRKLREALQPQIKEASDTLDSL